MSPPDHSKATFLYVTGPFTHWYVHTNQPVYVQLLQPLWAPWTYLFPPAFPQDTDSPAFSQDTDSPAFSQDTDSAFLSKSHLCQNKIFIILNPAIESYLCFGCHPMTLVWLYFGRGVCKFTILVHLNTHGWHSSFTQVIFTPFPKLRAFVESDVACSYETFLRKN